MAACLDTNSARITQQERDGLLLCRLQLPELIPDRRSALSRLPPARVDCRLVRPGTNLAPLDRSTDGLGEVVSSTSLFTLNTRLAREKATERQSERLRLI